MSLLELFCHVHDFCRIFQPQWHADLLAQSVQCRRRERNLSLSEIMTILIRFHQSPYRDFKAYYTQHVLIHLQAEYPGLVSYTRFVEFIPSVLIPLSAYLRYCRGTCTGISIVDSPDLTVCHNRRIAQHKVFTRLAECGKTSTGWFFGFKVHFVFNDRGELLVCTLTPGNVDDRKPVPQLVRRLFGKLVGDKGYISRKLQTEYRLLLRKRAIVEKIIDQLKNISQIEHSRHLSFANFLVNLLYGLIAYCHQPKKPSLHLDDLPALPA